MSLTVVLADDHTLMRVAFRAIFEAHGIAVVGEAADGDEVVAVALHQRPDVVLMDVRMPRRDGLAATGELLARSPGTRVVVLTTFDDDEYLDAALRAGACGFLLKNTSPEELVLAVRRVAAGDAVLDPAVTARILTRVSPKPIPTECHPRLSRLTGREREVFALVADGLTNAEIAARLCVGEATVKTHVSRFLAKLGLRDRVQAVIFAYDNGLVRD
jgi:DNA-binding NarL/FixJ family response regulator